MRALLDTNILLYAINADAPQHGRSAEYLRRLIDSGEPWCLTWTNIYEFLGVATHPSCLEKPLSSKQAMDIVSRMLECPSLEMLTETQKHAEALERVLKDVPTARGPFLHDCHIAALMLEHDVAAIVTADVEFRKFSFLKVVDPTK